MRGMIEQNERQQADLNVNEKRKRGKCKCRKSQREMQRQRKIEKRGNEARNAEMVQKTTKWWWYPSRGQRQNEQRTKIRKDK
jgi:hypothetical protein